MAFEAICGLFWGSVQGSSPILLFVRIYGASTLAVSADLDFAVAVAVVVVVFKPYFGLDQLSKAYSTCMFFTQQIGLRKALHQLLLITVVSFHYFETTQ